VSTSRRKAVTISGECLMYMSFASDITGVAPVDCIIDEETNSIIFLVPEGTAGKFVGKGGRNVRRLSKVLGKRIEVVEMSNDLKSMVQNIFLQAHVLSTMLRVTANGSKILHVRVKPEDRGLAIGKNGRNVRKATLILSRHFGIDKVVIE